MLKRLLVLCLLTAASLALFATGALAATDQEIRDALDQWLAASCVVCQSWIGKPVDSLIRTFGIPAKSYALTDGGTAIAYDAGHETIEFVLDPVAQRASQLRQAQINALASVPGGGYAASQLAYQDLEAQQRAERPVRVWHECWITFSTDARQIIVNWSRRGEGC